MEQPKIEISPSELRAMLKEYEYDPDVMCEDDERVIRIKRALQKLKDYDRILWVLYMELGASRKCGAVLGVSHSTILKEINRIKMEIRYQMMIDDYDDIS